MNRVGRCSKCGETKSFDQFTARSDRPLGRLSACKACHRAKSRAYNVGHPEVQQDRYQRHRDALNRRAKGRQQSARKRAIDIYGGCCIRCGVGEPLEFDHVNDDGEAHRLVEGHHAMYLRIASRGRKLTDVKLQLLCPPCHYFKRYTTTEVIRSYQRAVRRAEVARQAALRRGVPEWVLRDG